MSGNLMGMGMTNPCNKVSQQYLQVIIKKMFNHDKDDISRVGSSNYEQNSNWQDAS